MSSSSASATRQARGMLARCRALVSREGDQDTLFGEAIDRLTRCGEVSELARAHLLYGEWLRRQRRRADVREHLRTAHQTFQRLGADGFAQRARAELAASGEKARERTVDSTGVSHSLANPGRALTVREAQIAVGGSTSGRGGGMCVPADHAERRRDGSDHFNVLRARCRSAKEPIARITSSGPPEAAARHPAGRLSSRPNDSTDRCATRTLEALLPRR